MASGGWQAFRCDRCPLVIELGGLTAWDEDSRVRVDQYQVACAGCGTMHRVTEDGGGCHVTALPGPIRATRALTRPDGWGGDYESVEWATEADWRPVGPFPGGRAALDRLACYHCGQVGRMVTLGRLRRPDSRDRGPGVEWRCPVCGEATGCIGVSDCI